MSVINSSILAGSSGGSSYTIDQSCRFNDNDSESLLQNFSSSGNQKTWTFSIWVKRGNLYGSKLNTDYPSIWETGSGNGHFRLYSPTGGTIADQWTFLTCGTESFTGATNWSLVTQNEPEGPNFRDPTAWYHLVFACDTTQVAAADRMRIYINGVKLLSADYSVETYPTLNDNLPWMGDNSTSGNHSIGLSASNATYRWDGLMAEVYCTDGVANAADAFGEYHAVTGQWVPKQYTGSYGTNGFYLTFEDSADFGTDSSGLGNDFTPANLSAPDQLLDTPTNNYCTLNSDVKQTSPAVNLTSGNLVANEPTGSTWTGVVGTMAVSSGKWYYEFIFSSSANGYPGITCDQNTSFFSNETNPQDGLGIFYQLSNGYKRIDGTGTSYGDAVGAGDVVGVALDLDSGTQTLTFYNANVSQGAITLTGGLADADLYIPAIGLYSNTSTLNFGQDSSFNGSKTAQNNTDANGEGDFYYTPPAGYLAWCTANLAEPSIKDPSKHFESIYWTGDGTAIGAGGQAITGLGFDPDFVWAKNLSAVSSHLNTDKLRGATKYLSSNSSAIQATDTETLTSFDSDGFTIGNASIVNTNTNKYRAWCWLAADLTTGATNDEGDTTSYVSANPTAGFSIVRYTGTGSNTTIGHGLSAAPSMVIVKSMGILNSTADDWRMIHRRLTNANYYMNINATSGESSDSSYFNGTFPGATSFSLGTQNHTNESGESYVAYCFAPIPGFSALGKYYGNGNVNGPWVPTGFRVGALMIWNISASWNHPMNDHKMGAGVGDDLTGQGVWNEVNNPVWSNDTAAADLANSFNMDFCANGFKIRRAEYLSNSDNETFIYYAVAQYPFKYANAR